MRSRMWPILALGFGCLVLLIGLSSLVTAHRADRLHQRLAELNQSHQEEQRSLQRIRTGIYASALTVRDCLLAPAPLSEATCRKQLRENREALAQHLARLDGLDRAARGAKLASLRSEVEAYWRSVDPALQREPLEASKDRHDLLRQHLVPRRESVLALAEEIEDLGAAHWRGQQQEITASQQAFDRFLNGVTLVSLVLGCVVALVSVWCVSRLERLRRTEYQRCERAEQELRLLSQQLVTAQEGERRSISRELHDEVGQMVTGLRVTLYGLRKLHQAPREQFERKLQDALTLLEQILQSVRDLAMGLRPSMLDDLGLGSALEWQARQFSRHHDIPVSVQVEGSLDHLTEPQRISIFRIVQEALTNCARHARANSVEIRVVQRDGKINLTIADDGMGMQEPPRRGSSLGLLGIGERVRELGGSLSIQSHRQQGTTLEVQVPAERKATCD